MTKKLDTRTDLVNELKKYPITPAIEEMIKEAEAGEYHDYKNKKYVCGKVEVSKKLRAAGLIELAKRIEGGDFDEECDEDDKDSLREMMNQNGMSDPKFKEFFGLEDKTDPTKIPRIRGKVGQATEPEEYKGKWFFKMWLTTMGGGEGDELGQWGPFDTQTQAKQELERAARVACEAIELKVVGKTSGKYIDIKDNKLKDWDKEKKH